jgi:hypothetical protein
LTKFGAGKASGRYSFAGSGSVGCATLAAVVGAAAVWRALVVCRGGQAAFGVDAFVRDPYGRATEADTEEGSVGGTDEGFLSAGWTLLALVFAEPREKVDVRHAIKART